VHGGGVRAGVFIRDLGGLWNPTFFHLVHSVETEALPFITWRCTVRRYTFHGMAYCFNKYMGRCITCVCGYELCILAISDFVTVW
jgi:hypothetical protein